MSLARKLSLVTGSTSGIGLGIAKSFAKAGSDLIINGFGWVLTPLVQKQISDRAEALKIPFEEAKSRLLLEKQPSGGFVTPSQLGDLALFLASDSASEVRGVAWAMDGAWTAQ
eukprot:gene28868-35809_t